MKIKFTAILIFFSLLISVCSCSFNNNPGQAASTAIGAGAGVGTVALFGGNKVSMLLGGVAGGALGYYVSTLNFHTDGVTQAGGTVYTLGDFVTIEIPAYRLFDGASAELLPEATPILDSVVTVLNRNPNNNVLVSGNTSGFGTSKSERFRSERRAQQVASYLWANCVNSNGMRNLTYVGYGDLFPIANHIRADGIIANDRIQITSYPSKADLGVGRRHGVFHNIGAWGDSNPRKAPTTSMNNSPDSFALAENTRPTTRGSLTEVAPSQTYGSMKPEGYYKENVGLKGEVVAQSNVSKAPQTSAGPVVVVKQAGAPGYKGE